MSSRQSALCGRLHLLQIGVQVAQAGRPEGELALFASFSPHAQQARMLVKISET
jgi:hypothetical protein